MLDYVFDNLQCIIILAAGLIFFHRQRTEKACLFKCGFRLVQFTGPLKTFEFDLFSLIKRFAPSFLHGSDFMRSLTTKMTKKRLLNAILILANIAVLVGANLLQIWFK